jgi:hypothetical protein
MICFIAWSLVFLRIHPPAMMPAGWLRRPVGRSSAGMRLMPEAWLRIGRVQLVWLCRGWLEDEAGLGAGRRSSVTWGNGRVQALGLNRITRRWW